MCDPQTVATLIGLAAERRKQVATREYDRREKAHDLFLKQQEDVEANMTELLVPLFRNQIESAAERLEQLESQRSTKQAADVMASTIFDPPEWKGELIDRAAPGIAKGIEEGIDVALAELRVRPQRSSARGAKTTATEWLEQEGEELPDAFDVAGQSFQIATERPVWLRQAIARATRQTFQQPFWDEIAKTTKGDIEQVLRAGLADGLSTQEMGRQLRDLGIEYYRRRGLTIARTECLPGDVSVDGARVTAAHRRFYRGPWVEIITEAGFKFAGTPNHPMLTKRGWVGLGDLNKTDSLVRHDVGAENSGSARNSHIEHPPAPIREIFDSLSAVGIFERRCTTKPDFHGDGMNGHVDILYPDGELSCGRFVPIDQSRMNDILSKSTFGEILLIRLRNLFSHAIKGCKLCRLRAASYLASVTSNEIDYAGAVGSQAFADACAGFSSRISTKDLISVWSQFLMATEAAFHEKFSGFFESSQSVARLPNRVGHYSRIAFDNSADFDCAQSAEIKFDHPVIIRRTEFAGHVYNLSTRDGYFIANGFYTGNSANSLNAGRVEGIDKVKREMPAEISQSIGREWLSVLGNTTRDTHAMLDGVLAGADDMWELAGVRIPWPAHFNLPVRERASCQCSVISVLGADVPQEQLDAVSV